MNESAFERDNRVDTQCPGEWDRPPVDWRKLAFKAPPMTEKEERSVEIHLLLRIAEKEETK